MGADDNPYTLFLILVLLVLGMDPQSEQKLSIMHNFMEKTLTDIANVKSGVNSFNANMQSINSMVQSLQKR